MMQFKSVSMKTHIGDMEENLNVFEKNVQDAIKEGWELHGGSVVIKDIYSIYLIQFVTREEGV